MGGSSSKKSKFSKKCDEEEYNRRIEFFKKTYWGTPFVVACELEWKDDVELMIRCAPAAGIDVTKMVNDEGMNSKKKYIRPLLTTISNYTSADSFHIDIVDILLKNGADPALTDDRGWNALHYAVCDNNTTIVELLLEKMEVEDINHKNNDGQTPLDWCIECNIYDIKQTIIELIRKKGGKKAEEISPNEGNSFKKYKF